MRILHRAKPVTKVNMYHIASARISAVALTVTALSALAIAVKEFL